MWYAISVKLLIPGVTCDTLKSWLFFLVASWLSILDFGRKKSWGESSEAGQARARQLVSTKSKYLLLSRLNHLTINISLIFSVQTRQIYVLSFASCKMSKFLSFSFGFFQAWDVDGLLNRTSGGYLVPGHPVPNFQSPTSGPRLPVPLDKQSP